MKCTGRELAPGDDDHHRFVCAGCLEITIHRKKEMDESKPSEVRHRSPVRKETSWPVTTVGR
jgi:hypothetical protein